MFVIEDEVHSDEHGQFASLAEAVAELRCRAELPWNGSPNRAPCTGWMTCGRDYVIIEYDEAQSPWKELRRMPALKISANGLEWAGAIESVE